MKTFFSGKWYLFCYLKVRLSLIFRKKQIFLILFLQTMYITFKYVSCLVKYYLMIIFRLDWLSFAITLVAHPLTVIFQNSMAAGKFATQWKRANITPIHKKNDKQIVSNYRPVSLLPICSNIFEKLIFNELFKFLGTKICFLNINRVIARVSHVFINYLQSLMALKFWRRSNSRDSRCVPWHILSVW